jgi:type IV fimbrial biogenesis protein FimT
MKQQGFTLIELVIVISLVFTIGHLTIDIIGSTKYWLEPKRLFSALQEIRNIAVTKRQFTVLCPSSDSYNCTTDWQLSLIMFIDLNDNKLRDNDEQIIQTITPYNGVDRLITYPRTQIRFNPEGEINGYTGTLRYCSEFNAKGIVLSRVGRIRYLLETEDNDICDEVAL